MKSTPYSSEPHAGWLAWPLFAPFLCVLLVALASVPLDFALIALGVSDESGRPVSTLGFCLLLILPFLAMGSAIALWIRFVERRSFSTVGLGGTLALHRYARGLPVGLAMMASSVSLIWLFGGYQSGALFPAFASVSALGWIALLFLCFMFQAGIEEFIFRGWLLSTIARRSNIAAGFIGSSLAFTFLHFSPDQPLRVTLMSFVFGMFACAWARRQNGIWGVMGWHASWNWLGGVGFGVPITGLDVHLPALLVHLVPAGNAMLDGGADGPEGSLITITLLFAGTLALLFWPATERSKDRSPA